MVLLLPNNFTCS